MLSCLSVSLFAASSCFSGNSLSVSKLTRKGTSVLGQRVTARCILRKIVLPVHPVDFKSLGKPDVFFISKAMTFLIVSLCV